MSITVQMEQDLKAAKLDKLFEDHKATWIDLARQTYVHLTKTFPKGATIHQQDVAENVEKLLRVNESLKNYLASKKLKEKYWFIYFAHLINDRGWAEISA
jgi:hypothetical protein